MDKLQPKAGRGLFHNTYTYERIIIQKLQLTIVQFTIWKIFAQNYRHVNFAKPVNHVKRISVLTVKLHTSCKPVRRTAGDSYLHLNLPNRSQDLVFVDRHSIDFSVDG